MKSKLPFIIVGAVLVFALIGGVWFYRSRKPSIVLITKGGVPGAQPPQVIGPNTPHVTIEEFGDFQCPPCGKVHPVLKKVEEDYGSRVGEIRKLVAMNGPAARPGDKSQITGFEFKGNSIILEINGGPKKKKKWYQRISVAGMPHQT